MARPRSDSPLLFDLAARPDFAFETQARKEGAWPVAGLDEAGRGPLAGPVVAAAVILDPERIPEGLDDSKRLTEAARGALFDAVLGTALAVGIASLSAESVDRSDILRASLEAMRRALGGLAIAPRLALVDGNQMPPGLPCPARTLVKGDQRSQSIAAASILAKVLRDRMMRNCGRCDGRYGFELHKGYATGRHRDAIAAYGPAGRLHRLSFAPFRLADPAEAMADLVSRAS